MIPIYCPVPDFPRLQINKKPGRRVKAKTIIARLNSPQQIHQRAMIKATYDGRCPKNLVPSKSQDRKEKNVNDEMRESLVKAVYSPVSVMNLITYKQLAILVVIQLSVLAWFYWSTPSVKMICGTAVVPCDIGEDEIVLLQFERGDYSCHGSLYIKNRINHIGFVIQSTNEFDLGQVNYRIVNIK